MSPLEIRRLPDLAALAAAAAEDVIECIDRAVSERNRCRIAVAGGSTPRPVYRRLAEADMAARVDWSRVVIFWGDERCVPPTQEASNYRMVQEALLSKVPIPQENIHRIRGEWAPEEAARAYEKSLGSEPLDLVLLGMGDDGHTASLFPDTPGLDEHRTRVIGTTAPVEPSQRVSLTLRAINEAGVVRFWVSGASKADTLLRVWNQVAQGAPELPAARVRPSSGRLSWFVDAAAASQTAADSASEGEAINE